MGSWLALAGQLSPFPCCGTVGPHGHSTPFFFHMVQVIIRYMGENPRPLVPSQLAVH